MGSLFGSQTKPTVSTPTVGDATQTNFFNSLYGMGLTPNTQGGGMQFAGMPAYQGQLTPDLSQMMSSNVWNSWNPQAQGMSQLQGTTSGIQGGIGQVSPYVSQIQQGGAGPGSQSLNAYIGGGAPAALSGLLGGNNPLSGYLGSGNPISGYGGGSNPLSAYLGGGQQVSYPLPKPLGTSQLMTGKSKGSN